MVTPSPTVSRPVEDVSPNLTLSCSVSGEGMFSWQWTNPDGDPPSEVMLYDTTRTSTAVFTRISSTSEGMYQCEATPLPAQGQQSGFQDINVQQLQCKEVKCTVLLYTLCNNYYACMGQPFVLGLLKLPTVTAGSFNKVKTVVAEESR